MQNHSHSFSSYREGHGVRSKFIWFYIFLTIYLKHLTQIFVGISCRLIKISTRIIEHWVMKIIWGIVNLNDGTFSKIFGVASTSECRCLSLIILEIVLGTLEKKPQSWIDDKIQRETLGLVLYYETSGLVINLNLE